MGQRRSPGLVSGLRVRPPGTQQPRDGHMLSCDRLHQRRDAERAGGIDVRPRVQQQAHRLRHSTVRGTKEGRDAVLRDGIGGRIAAEQLPDPTDVTGTSGAHQRRDAVGIGDVDIIGRGIRVWIYGHGKGGLGTGRFQHAAENSKS